MHNEPEKGQESVQRVKNIKDMLGKETAFLKVSGAWTLPLYMPVHDAAKKG